MSPMMLRFFTLVGIALAAASMQLQARAATPDAATARQVQATVQAQLDAFAANDAEAAFAMASPDVRRAMGSARSFLASVRGNYPMVHRPAAVTFLPLAVQDDGQVLQAVGLRDGAGKSWVAVFALRQQQDRSWRVDGCLVSAPDGRVA